MLRAFVSLAILQAASSVDQNQNAEYVRSGLQAIGDGLQQIASPGSMRQVAINALMKSVEKSDAVDPYVKTRLEEVKELLLTLIQEMVNETNLNQGELERIIDDIDDCNTALEHMTNNAESTVNGAASAHDVCRAEELVLYRDDADKCNQLDTFLNDLSLPTDLHDCRHPAADKNEIDEWETFLQIGLEFFTSAENSYVGLRNACTNSSTTWEEKSQECDALQKTYDSDLCQWRQALLGRQIQIETCAANKTAEHEARQVNIMNISSGKGPLAVIIYHVVCLVDKLLDEADLTNFTTACPFKDEDDASIVVVTNTPVSAPPHLVLDMTGVEHYPGSQNWTDVRYPNVDQDLKDLEDGLLDSHACAAA